MQVQYKIKKLMRQKEISIRNLVPYLPVGRSTLERFINCQATPKRNKVGDLQKTISAVLLQHFNCKEEELAEIWETEPYVCLQAAFNRKISKTLKQKQHQLIFRRNAMQPEVIEKFNLSRDPFEHRLYSPEDVLMLPPHKKVYRAMMNAAQKTDMLAVIGQVGSGKSIIKTLFKLELAEQGQYVFSEPVTTEKNRARPSAIIQAMLYDILYNMSPESGNLNLDTLKSNTGKSIQMNFNRESSSRVLYSTLEHKFNTEKLKPILIIDEAHWYSNDVLKNFKQLYEFQSGFNKLLTIILIAQPELKHRLETNWDIREFAQRINVVTVDPIPSFIKQYVEHRIARAGGNAETIFESEAYKTVRELLHGSDFCYPLMIGNLISESMDVCYQQGAAKVTAEYIQIGFKNCIRPKERREAA